MALPIRRRIGAFASTVEIVESPQIERATGGGRGVRAAAARAPGFRSVGHADAPPPRPPPPALALGVKPAENEPARTDFALSTY
jgi:hypothetical protein